MPRSSKRKKKLPPAPTPVRPDPPREKHEWLSDARRGIRDAFQYRPQPEDFRNLAFAVAVLLGSFAATVVWMLFGPYALFPPAGFIDPWFYPGYFTNFAYLFHHYGITYYVSRLPWILPGLGAFAIASPQVASLLLCCAVITVSAVSLYWMVHWHYGRAPAILAAVALATNPYFMSAASWHYPDGPAIAYAMVALALYLRPRGRKRNSVLAAAALALAGFANMSAGPMILSVLVIPLWLSRRSWKGLLREAVCAVVGVALATLILMMVSSHLLHNSLFFVAQIKMFLYTQGNPSYLTNMWGTGLGFLATAFRLFFPAFLLLFGVALWISIRKAAGPLTATYLAAFTCCLFYALDQFVRNGVTLRVTYHSSYMLVPMFGLAGTLLGELWKHGRGSAAAGPALATAALALPVVWNRWHPVYVAPRFWIFLAAVAAAGIVLAIQADRPQWRLRDAACALLIFTVFLSPALDSSLQYFWAPPQILHGSNLSSGRHAVDYRCILDLQSKLKSSTDPARRLQFWFDRDEPPSFVYESAAALHLSGYSDLKKELSTGSREEIEATLVPNATLVHLTMHPERLVERNRLLASRGMLVGPERRSNVPLEENSFIVSLQDILDMSHLH